MPTKEDIRKVCLNTIAVFKKKGLECCLVGSAATTLWGVPRVPNDIDIVVMTVMHNQEALKRMLASEDRDFTLVASSNPRNTYKVVWCTVPSSYARVKVDVLVPGVMNIPHIAAARTVWFKDQTLPSMPLLPLLLLKLQAWDDHRNSSYRRMDLREKQHVDVADIKILLPIARKANVQRKNGDYLPQTFLSDADRRVRSYVLSYPDSKDQWKALGFTVETVSTRTADAQLKLRYLQKSGVLGSYSLRY